MMNKTQGWCKRNYHADGKRKFDELIDGLCSECRQQPHQNLPIIPIPRLLQSPLVQVRQIIQQINEVTVDPKKALMRQGFNRIDELGSGSEILGYSSDEEYLKAEFRFNQNYLRQQRTCGRIEKLIGVPIGTYNIDDLYALFQFRVVINTGGTDRKTRIKTRPNINGIKLLREAWKIAKTLASGGLPNRQHIKLAIDKMAATGKAKDTKLRRQPKWKDKHQALFEAYTILEKEHEQVKKERDRLLMQLGKLPKKQLETEDVIPTELIAEIQPKLRHFAEDIEEFHQKMSQLYQEQTRQQYQQYKLQQSNS